MSAHARCAVLHVACHPLTGPWSVMRDLAKAQVKSGLFAGVGIAVMVDSTWPASYRREISDLPVAFYSSSLPRTFGTAAFLYLRACPPPLGRWIENFAARSGATQIVLHLHNAWMSGVFLPLPEIPGLELTAVATFHGVNESFEGKPIRRHLHRWMAQRLVRYRARLTSVDAANTERAERLFGIPRAAFSVVPNGIEPPPDEAVVARPLGALLTVGHVGSLIPQKGWRMLADAAERLNRDSVVVRVLLAGQGPEAGAAADWAARHSEWAQFLGHLDNPRVNLMPRLDLLCLMSQWEGLPMSIVEALSVGLPVIATDVGGVREAVQPGETGLLIPRQVDALVDTLRDLLQHRSRISEMSRRARQYYEERFTLKRILLHYHRIYTENPA